MTKEDFIKKYIYGIGNDALTDNQEAIDMAKDLDRYFTEKLRQYNVSGRSEQLLAFFRWYCNYKNNIHEGSEEEIIKEWIEGE
jgi:hypothetical protein